jgi:hypothetical protein
MARKRKKSGFFAKRYKKAKTGFKRYIRGVRGNKPQLLHVDAMLYGALRGEVSSRVTPYLNNILPQTATYNDNIAMAGISWAMAKFGTGMIRDIGQKGLIVENALVGADIKANVIPSIGQGNNIQNASW